MNDTKTDVMSHTNKIPTAEEFARASSLSKEKSRNLDSVREEVLRHFMGSCPLHDFFILNQRDVDFRAYVFFKRDEDIRACKSSGIQDQIVGFVYSELERVGRGKNEQIKVAFEFDSDENVKNRFQGDYFLRLR
jgi:hypothetical protein